MITNQICISDTENMDEDYVEENSKDGAMCLAPTANLVVVENIISEVQIIETNSKKLKKKALK